jgi:sporulation protein YlmC with PRC-barrel domain
MRASMIGGLLVAALMSTTAFSQTANQGNSSTPAATSPAASSTASSTSSATMSGQWRASKLIGVDIYNEQNEKLGDIDEILMDQSGKVTGYVIGVGGFLGMGTREIMVEPSKIKFVNEPVRTSSAANDRATSANASADRPRPGAGTMGTTGSATANARANDRQWSPDHGVMSGASKDQLKSMPEFKYDSASR